MCVSALVENDGEKLAAKFGLPHLSVPRESEELSLPRRIEARDPALVVRRGTGGRFVAEPMAFNPYALRRGSLGGDMWAEQMLSTRHGIVVLKGYSEWVSLGLLVGHGVIPVHEAHCAFNRFAAKAPGPGSRAGDRLVLANFQPTAGGSLLVPVLFDARRDLASNPGGPVASEFAVVSDEVAPHQQFGAPYAPVCLSMDAAMEWLCTDDAEGLVDWDEVLADSAAGPMAFGLFKSA